MNPLLDLMDRCTQLGIRLCPRELAAIEYGSQVLVVVDLPNGKCAHRLHDADTTWQEAYNDIRLMRIFGFGPYLKPEL